jgi:hypothetical protein
MSRRNALAILVAATLALSTGAMAGPIAELQMGGAEVQFRALVEHAGAVLTVSTPGGAVLRYESASGVPSFNLFDAQGQTRPDGVYNWELRLAPQVSEETTVRLRTARQRGDRAAAAEQARAGISGDLVQAGSFTIAGGAFVDGGAAERPTRSATANAVRNVTAADQVIPDDLIVQGSGCFGFDCLNNENFGFDTIKLKENNLRIKAEDTSVGTFPTNDWQLTFNDSASGGSSKFSVEDITGVKVPFTITAGAATNSIFVDSTGRVGLRSSTPVLDLHIATANTPAIRLEQTNAGGFTAQTWDIAGNEANFFVRSVTTGSQLPFRIRPGAPTSSIDISADGDVGIGTGSPDAKLDVETNATAAATVRYTNTNASGFAGGEYFEGATQGLFVGLDNANNVARINAVSSFPLVILTNSTERIRFPAPGGNFITATNGAVLNSIGQWVDGSSRELKQDISELSASAALEALRGLQPVTFAYRAAPGEVQAGFIAEDVPALVAQADRKGLSSLEIVAVLTKVVQRQQQTIDEELVAQREDLQRQNAELRERLAQLERLLSAP